MTRGPWTLLGPTSWAAVPARFSFSALEGVRACARRFQLLRSTWGDYQTFPQRVHPKALEGQIVHDAIDRLMRALVPRGCPAIGSPQFRDVAKTIGFWAHFATEIERVNTAIRRRPFVSLSHLVTTRPEDLANQAIRLFREQYRAGSGGHTAGLCDGPRATHRSESEAADEPANLASVPPATPWSDAQTPNLGELLDRAGMLSEVSVAHPALAFHGIIDLVVKDGDATTIIDFKTGARSDNHLRQLRVYALLWWRATGVVPTSVQAQYLDGRVDETVGGVAALDAVERELEAEVKLAADRLAAHPAEPSVGPGCRHCPVRPRCAEGWAYVTGADGAGGRAGGDFELTVLGPPGIGGFTAESLGERVSVVYPRELAPLFNQIAVGERIAVLSATRDGQKPATIAINHWTEIFTLRGSESPG